VNVDAEGELDRLIREVSDDAPLDEAPYLLYRTIVEQAAGIVYIEAPYPDSDGEYKDFYVSPQTLEWFGYPPERWMKDYTAWQSVLHPADRPSVLQAIADSEEGSPYSIEYRMRKKDGEVIWVHDEAFLVRSKDGTPLYWQGLITDISQRKRAEDLQRALDLEEEASAKLRSLNELKDTLLEAVSHDFRTPLSSISGLVETLMNPDIHLSEEDSRDFLQRILASAHRLQSLVENLLDLDRLNRGALSLDAEVTDIGARVAQVIRAMEADNHHTSFSSEEIHARVDAAKFERIVENLVMNARKHTPEGTHIWVKARAEADGFLLLVEDDGPGVPDEMKEALFEPFTTTGPHLANPGVGLGLSLVRRLAELHGGTAWVSDREGGGASFTVFFPGRMHS
jgi:PAS domain S-box-containing protein